MTDAATSPHADRDAERRSELGCFLRSRRERLTPGQVGLLHGRRRRTPGLRREEVAQLSGVGITWYTWLEQGRRIQVSDQVLDALARSLRLDRHERSYLFALAGSPSADAAAEPEELGSGLRLILDRFGGYPAAVLNGRFDIVAHNHAYAALLGDLDALPLEERNIVWLVFTHPSFRQLLPDWESTARLCVARLRARMADHAHERAWRALVRRLQVASADFQRIWGVYDVAGSETVRKRFAHRLGMLRYHSTSLWLDAQSSLHLVAYTPADPATVRLTEALASLPPASLLAPATASSPAPGTRPA